MTIHDKNDIKAALHEKIDAFNRLIISLDAVAFEATPGNKWSAGQNLDHLLRSIKPLTTAYGLPRFTLRLLFGKANRPSRPYEELVAKYRVKLAAGGQASGRFIPPVIYFTKKDQLVKQYNEQKERLIKKIDRWQEADLDKYILPHPLLGKTTLREMLFFTIYHNQHHLEIVNRMLSTV